MTPPPSYHQNALARLIAMEQRQAALEATIKRLLDGIEEDARFLKRAIWTGLISVISGVFLAMCGAILRAHGIF